MSKNYDMIATVDIDIQNPIVDDASFDNLLIAGPLPETWSYWKATTALAKGGLYIAGNHLYECTTAGTSGSEAPTDTGTATITDGTAKLKYVRNTPADVGVYSSLDEVVDAGWTITGDTPDPVGVAAQVAFSQSPRPTRVYIAPIKKTLPTGESDFVAESIVDTVRRAIPVSGWYVVCPIAVSDAQVQALAEYIETQEKMCAYTELGFFGAGTGGSNVPTVGSVYYRTFGVYGRENTNQADEDIPAANKYINVALTAKWLSYSSGSETAAFKRLSAVYPSVLSTTEMTALANANLNYFITVGNANISMNGKTLAGEWADVIRFRDWLKNEMQVRVVNLFIVNPKIPYTDNGIALVQNVMIAVLKAGQDAGGIAPIEFDADGNTIPAYQTSVPLAASLTASEKASRKLKKCNFKARLAGAIHFAELKGSLTYEL